MQVKISKWDYLPSGTYDLVETNGKLEKAIANAGLGANPRTILMEHDKLGGLIRDKEGKPMPVGTFWNIEKVKMVQKQKEKESWDKKKEFFKSLIELIKGFKEIVWFVLFLLGIGLFLNQNRIWPFTQ